MFETVLGRSPRGHVYARTRMYAKIESHTNTSEQHNEGKKAIMRFKYKRLNTIASTLRSQFVCCSCVYNVDGINVCVRIAHRHSLCVR